ncbi:ubiquinol-cytochrome C reductase [Piedraia hortae CBS 480.64]|uniref:Complex III subunit 9 n=1 Tax=Piedraia hortae CBS 480.64 TaxID=1314780 RepID=A0A6A7BUG0_9PEZI|nr:ubiquinol-cytochrome C reductase [Piedraia hortae CBS 480.64]
MAGVLSGIYGTVMRRNYTFLTAIFVGTFFAEIAFDQSANRIWDRINYGRQWKDIKYRYVEQAEDDE